MRVKDYMTTRVFAVRADKKVLIAREIMEWANVRHVPVVNANNELIGLISHRDLLRASIAAFDASQEPDQRQHLGKLTIESIMQTDVRCIDPEAPVQGAAHLMRNGHFGCLPVVDRDNGLIGIITEHDLLGIVESLAREEAKA